MFESFFGSKKKEITRTDLVWKNEYAKYKGILKFIDKTKSIIFVYYFNETKKQIKKTGFIARFFYKDKNSFI